MKKIIVLNNKMNMPISMGEFDKLYNNIMIIHCVSYPFLNISYKNIKLGSQDVSRFIIGPYTGEVSATLLKQCGVEYTIVGHSERRNSCGDNLNIIKSKISNLLKEDIKPIICISELFSKQELEFILKDIGDLSKIIIAYEPLSAIGTGITPSNLEIFNTINKIKEDILKLKEQNVKVLYGGSVNKSNIEQLNNINNLDGFLIGKASNDYLNIKKIIEVLL